MQYISQPYVIFSIFSAIAFYCNQVGHLTDYATVSTYRIGKKPKLVQVLPHSESTIHYLPVPQLLDVAKRGRAKQQSAIKQDGSPFSRCPEHGLDLHQHVLHIFENFYHVKILGFVIFWVQFLGATFVTMVFHDTKCSVICAVL